MYAFAGTRVRIDRWIRNGTLSLLSLLLLMGPAVSYAGHEQPRTHEGQIKLVPQRVITETNKARAREGLPKLRKDMRLMRAAKEKAESMATDGYFSHTTPRGEAFTSFIDRAGYEYTSVGENIAIYFTSEKAVVSSWLKSPPHRENIMNPAYTHIGVGLAYGTLNGRTGWFGVQIFGAP